MGSLKRALGYVLLLLVLAFGVFFSIQNTARAPLDLLIWQFPEQRVALWVLLAFAAGGITGLVVSIVALLRLKSRSLLLQRRLDKQTKELEQLRSSHLPVNNLHASTLHTSNIHTHDPRSTLTSSTSSRLKKGK